MENKDEANTADDITPEYLRHWPGLTMRRDGGIVDALPEDVEVAKNYPRAKNKGEVKDGKRLTVLTKANSYRTGEEVRVIHVVEFTEPGHEIFIMGPKPIYGEYVDDKPATPEGDLPVNVYDGPIPESPGVDYNYDITSYRFSEPGTHRIYWQTGGLRSNTIELEIAP